MELEYAAIIKGALVAVFLMTLKFKISEFRWWIAMLCLTGMINL